MRRTSFGDAACPVARSLDEIGDWWTLLIVRDALHGIRRFGEFQKSLGLAKNILASRLRKMVTDGILEIRPRADGRANNEYHLTEKGLRLRLVLTALRQWGEDHLFTAGEPMMIMVDKAAGRRIGRLNLTARDGRVPDPTDIIVKMGRAGR
jgi:DNA-binding HxlR family transcriptional regulator